MSTKQHLSIVAESKICAILKYYNENVIKKNQLDELLVSNKLHKLSLFCFSYFIRSIIINNIVYFENFHYVRNSTNQIVLKFDKLLHKKAFKKNFHLIYFCF